MLMACLSSLAETNLFVHQFAMPAPRYMHSINTTHVIKYSCHDLSTDQ